LNATDTIERDQLLRNSERPELPIFEQAEKEPGTLVYATSAPSTPPGQRPPVMRLSPFPARAAHVVDGPSPP
jgi:hypothetical protein